MSTTRLWAHVGQAVHRSDDKQILPAIRKAAKDSVATERELLHDRSLSALQNAGSMEKSKMDRKAK
jgi:hypothetical protein